MEKRYCAVYVPLKDNNQVVGCVFAGQPTSDITNYIMQKVGTMLIVSAVVYISRNCGNIYSTEYFKVD